jgi:hypothetical protein
MQEVLSIAGLKSGDLPGALITEIQRGIRNFDQTTHLSPQNIYPVPDDEVIDRQYQQIAKFTNECTSFIYKTPKSKYTLVSNLDIWFASNAGKLMYLANYYKNGILISKNLELFAIYGTERAYSVQGQFAASLNKRDTTLKKPLGVLT